MLPHLRGAAIKAISLDCQGTLYHHRAPIENVYARLAASLLSQAPSADEFREAFRVSYSETLRTYPCYRYPSHDDANYSTRRWWRELCRRTLEHTGKGYSDEQIDRFFRGVYQHYGSLAGYAPFPDAVNFVKSLSSLNTAERPAVILGVTANCSARTIDTTLPVLQFSEHMHFFTSSQEAGCDKPSLQIYAQTYRALQQWDPTIKKNEVLHIGASVKDDYAAAKEFGFQALWLERPGAKPSDPGSDLHLAHHLETNTVKGLDEVCQRLGMQ